MYSTDKQWMQRGIEFKKKRMEQADMLTSDQAAELAGVSRVTIANWVKAGKCIAVQGAKRGYKLPKWQFESPIFEILQEVQEALQTVDGWRILAFWENGQGALNGASPLQARMTCSTPAQTIINLAIAESH